MFCKLCSCISCLVVLIPSLIIGVAYFVDKDSRVAVTNTARFLFKPQTYCKDSKAQLELGGWIIGKSQRINGKEVSVNLLGKTAMIGDVEISHALRFRKGPCQKNVAFEGKVKAALTGDYCDGHGRQVFEVSKATGFYVADGNERDTLGTILHKDVLLTVIPTGVSDVAGGMSIIQLWESLIHADQSKHLLKVTTKHCVYAIYQNVNFCCNLYSCRHRCPGNKRLIAI